jgi:signal transduction histidine kinase
MSERADHERRTARRVATVLVSVFVALWASRWILALGVGLSNESTGTTDSSSFLLDLTFTMLAAGLFIAVGWAIVTRQPRNTIGWLLIAIPLAVMLSVAVGDYATAALKTRPGTLPFGVAAAWLDRWLIVVALGMFIPIFLLYPDGKLPSRRWRPVLWLLIGSFAITITSFAITPGQLTGAFADIADVNVTNPLGVRALEAPLKAITLIGGFAMFASGLLAGASLFVRYRGASQEVRQQIRWLAFVAAAFIAEMVVIFAVSAIAGDSSDIGQSVGNIMFWVVLATLVFGIPLACGIAILKYRLYDLDIVVRKAVVFGLLAVFIAVVYGAIVGGISAIISSASSSALSFVAAAVLAVTFQPARDRARRLADRLVYGQRATPYEVLADFSDRVGEAYASEDVLSRMATVLRDGTGAVGARVLLRVGSDEQEAARVGAPTSDEYRAEVIHQGEDLGALAVSMPASDPMNPAKQQLVEDLASQAGLVLRNVRLIEELRASRQRLVAAQDEERRKLERNLHDGAQQQLVALAVQLKLLEQTAGKDPARDQQLAAKLGSQATAALEDLRDLARGIYPPLLADKGLAAALENQARKAAVPTTVEADAVGRYPQEIEATIYFCTLEALNNVAKYSEASRAVVRLSQVDGHIEFAVEDDGRGFDASAGTYGTGLQGMADRLDAVGGELRVESTPGAGSTVSGSVPVEHRS